MDRILDIFEYEGLYAIDIGGNVYSYPKIGGHKKTYKIKRHVSNSGYFYVGLHKQGRVRNVFLHRLVAQAFILNMKNKPDVNHKDGNKRNNKIDNLEWVTKSENAKHAEQNGLVCHMRNKKGQFA